MKTVAFFLLVVMTSSLSLGQTPRLDPAKNSFIAAQESVSAQGTFLSVENGFPKQLKAVNVLSFEDISDEKKKELKEDCRILDRLINKALPDVRQNTLGVNVNHTASGKMSYIAGKGFILVYDLPYSLTLVDTHKKEEPKKELSEWEKAREELQSNSWRYRSATQKLSGVLFYESSAKQLATLPAPKIEDMKKSVADVLTNVKNMRAAIGETVTVFLHGKATNANNKLVRTVIAFEAKISTNVTEKDVRSRAFTENVQIVTSKGNAFIAR